MHKIARQLNLGGTTREEQVDALISAVINLMKRINMPLSIRELGIDETEFMAKGSKACRKSVRRSVHHLKPRVIRLVK